MPRRCARRTWWTRCGRVISALLGLVLLAGLTWMLAASGAAAATSSSTTLCATPPPPTHCVGRVGGSGIGSSSIADSGGVLGTGIKFGAAAPSASLAYTGAPLAILILLGAGLLFAGVWSAAAGRD